MWISKTLKKRRMWLIIFLVIVLVVVGFAATIVGIDSYQYRRNQGIIATMRAKTGPSRTLVAFFSRSGNTELMARRIAQIKHAHVLPIQAEVYPVGVSGWLHALRDARDTTASITPSRIDLSAYDTLYIGAPIWLYSPAPPVFAFVRNNDLIGKQVILFNSMNSKFEQQYIDAFKQDVEASGGSFVDHIWVNRGRMTQQMDVETFLKEVEGKVK